MAGRQDSRNRLAGPIKGGRIELLASAVFENRAFLKRTDKPITGGYVQAWQYDPPTATHFD